jgi:hypothetical protein
VNRSPLILGYGDLYGKASSANTPLARAFAPGPRFGGKIKEIATNVVKLHNAGERVILASRQAARLRDMLSEISITPDVRAELLTTAAGRRGHRGARCAGRGVCDSRGGGEGE